MRKILLAATLLLGVVTALPGRADAGSVLGFHRGRPFGFGAPVAVVPFAYPSYPYPYYPAPYVYGPSYFRPDAPYAWNAQRNWRDTWEDDGVKVHSYTLR